MRKRLFLGRFLPVPSGNNTTQRFMRVSEAWDIFRLFTSRIEKIDHFDMKRVEREIIRFADWT